MNIIFFLLKSGLTITNVFIDEKNLQKSGMTGELISVHSYYMILSSFQS